MQLAIFYAITLFLAGVRAYPNLVEKNVCVGDACETLQERDGNNVDYHWDKRAPELEKRIVLQCKYNKTCCCPNGGRQCMKCATALSPVTESVQQRVQ